MKFESQYLEETSKNKEAIEELENALRDILCIKEEERTFVPIFNPISTEKNSLTFLYKNKRFEIIKNKDEFTGEISDKKNKIGISGVNSKFLFNKYQELFRTGEILIHNGPNP